MGAAALLLAIITTFDSCLGRVEDPFLRLMHGDRTRRERNVTTVYYALAAVLTLVSVADRYATWMTTAILATSGLLLAAVVAARSCASAKERGKFERAPSYGLSNRRIVLATWLGPLLLIVPVVFLTTLAGIMHWHPEFTGLLQVCVLPAYLLAAGAAWCSVGVAMGMWLSRRLAVLLTIVIYTLVVLIVPIYAWMLFGVPLAQGDWLGSPLFAVGRLTIALGADNWHSATGFLAPRSGSLFTA